MVDHEEAENVENGSRSDRHGAEIADGLVGAGRRSGSVMIDINA
jgi:hypothetical protein